MFDTGNNNRFYCKSFTMEVSILENKTMEKIFFSSFRLFLENGYEATNIRDICKDVGIKASTLYFYYKSKEDLFFIIYDGISMDYLNYFKGIETSISEISVEEKLFSLLKQKIKYFALDISKQKLILRYHLFPPKDLASKLREKYTYYTNEENKIISKIILNCKDNNLFLNENINDNLIEYKRLENYLIYEMTVFGIKINDREFSKLWDVFWNNATK